MWRKSRLRLYRSALEDRPSLQKKADQTHPISRRRTEDALRDIGQQTARAVAGGHSLIGSWILCVAHFLHTDEVEEAVSAIEMVSESVAKTRIDIYRWKWALIAMHSAVQGFMVLALRGSNGLLALKDNSAAAWLAAYECGGQLPEERLDTYENLYEKVKSDRLLIFMSTPM